eukprot:g68957.t1
MAAKSQSGGKPLQGSQLVADLAAAAGAGFCVAPLVTAVDKALAENASGKAKLVPSFLGSLKGMITSPIKSVRSPAYLWIWLVYGSTYATANLCETICAAQNRDPGTPKWLSTFVVNTSTCMAKDRAFAKLFGTSAPTSVPLGSYGAWLSRDLLSMFVFFTLPPIVGKQVAHYTGSQKSGEYAAQFVLPLALQTITTPMHLLGYEIYNNPDGDLAQRIAFLKKDYWGNVGMRMTRQLAPWSVGVIGNKELRGFFTRTFLLRSVRSNNEFRSNKKSSEHIQSLNINNTHTSSGKRVTSGGLLVDSEGSVECRYEVKAGDGRSSSGVRGAEGVSARVLIVTNNSTDMKA